MQGRPTRGRTWLLMAWLGVLQPGIAHAYIDPGTGAYVVQLLIALAGAVAFYAMQPVRMFKAWFRRLTGKTDQPPPP